MIYFLLILLFMPIPLIIKIKYRGKLDIFIYNKKISIHKNRNKNKNKNKNKKKSINRQNFKLFWKPYIKVNIKLLYGFDDAAATAISYGLIFSVLPLINRLINKFFNIKGFSQDIKLDYKRKIFDLYIRCIILFNIAQIIVDLIYIIYLNFKRGVIYGKSSNRQSNEKHYGKSEGND